MAIVQNPVTGRTKKKFGSAVFSKQFGKNTMRTKPVEVRNPKTLLQRQQRSKFSLMVALSRMFMGFIRVAFKQAATSMSAFNVFVKSNISNVFTGVYPNYSIDFTKLIVAKGTLTGVNSGTVAAAAGRKIDIAWSDNSGNGDALATDKAMVLVINYTKKLVAHDTTTKTRADAALELIVKPAWVGDTVHAFMSFKTEAGNMVADSTYLGDITVLA
jgi:hypothetical protein